MPSKCAGADLVDHRDATHGRSTQLISIQLDFSAKLAPIAPAGDAQGSEINVKCIAREVLGEFKHGIEARRQAVQSSRPD